jgi:hypothetical protein
MLWQPVFYIVYTAQSQRTMVRGAEKNLIVNLVNYSVPFCLFCKLVLTLVGLQVIRTQLGFICYGDAKVEHMLHCFDFIMYL